MPQTYIPHYTSEYTRLHIHSVTTYYMHQASKSEIIRLHYLGSERAKAVHLFLMVTWAS